eukprot:GHVT01007816.1.p2 GENE.GHVT01007816.1~~GHVT01007816.1.p2  ORF type:complete len:127 (-),score=25.50 GHVT01007816.1:636-1016(-)
MTSTLHAKRSQNTLGARPGADAATLASTILETTYVTNKIATTTTTTASVTASCTTTTDTTTTTPPTNSTCILLVLVVVARRRGGYFFHAGICRPRQTGASEMKERMRAKSEPSSVKEPTMMPMPPE